MLSLKEKWDRFDEVWRWVIDGFHNLHVTADKLLRVDYSLADFYYQNENVLLILGKLDIGFEKIPHNGQIQSLLIDKPFNLSLAFPYPQTFLICNRIIL